MPWVALRDRIVDGLSTLTRIGGEVVVAKPKKVRMEKAYSHLLQDIPGRSCLKGALR